MKYLNSNKLISHLFAISSILLAVACITISSSFALTDRVLATKRWNVYFSDIEEKDENGYVSILNDRLNIDVSLNNKSNIFKFITEVKNDGDFDAKLLNMKINGIEETIVGTSSVSGKTYYLSDFVDVYVKYYGDNKLNKVVEGNDVKIGDVVHKGTKNILVISVRLKGESELTTDEITFLNANIEENLDFSLNIDFNYIENGK